MMKRSMLGMEKVHLPHLHLHLHQHQQVVQLGTNPVAVIIMIITMMVLKEMKHQVVASVEI